MIKDFFLHDNDFIANDFCIRNGKPALLGQDTLDWSITLVDTGFSSNIGQRLLKVRELLEDDEYFLANYSDGLSDVDPNIMYEELRSGSMVANFVSVKPSNSFSKITRNKKGQVTGIDYLSNTIRINGGFFVLHRHL